MTMSDFAHLSPTQLLARRSVAYVRQSGRDAQFSTVYSRMYQLPSLSFFISLTLDDAREQLARLISGTAVPRYCGLGSVPVFACASSPDGHCSCLIAASVAMLVTGSADFREQCVRNDSYMTGDGRLA